jgi:hypothetical protein
MTTSLRFTTVSFRTVGTKPFSVLAVTLLIASAVVAGATSTASATPRARTGTAPVETVQLVPGTTQLTAVSCNSKGLCLAVGSDANGDAVVVPITDGTPGSPEIFSSTTLDAINCPNSTTCVAVGDQPTQLFGCYGYAVGLVLTFTNGNLTNAQDLEENCPPGATEAVYLYGVGCRTGSNCLAVGFDLLFGGMAVPIKKDAPQNELPVAPNGLNNVACRSTGYCIIVGQTSESGRSGTGWAEVFNDSENGNWSSGGGALLGVACHSTGICIAVGRTNPFKSQPSKGVVLPLALSPQKTVTVARSTILNGVACSKVGYYCAAVGADHAGVGVLVPISYETVGQPQKISGTSDLYSVGCASIHFCVAVGSASGSGEGVMVTFGLPG